MRALGTALVLVCFSGVLLAAFMYLVRPALAERGAKMFAPLYRASLNKLYFDEIYQALIVKPAEGLATAASSCSSPKRWSSR